MTISFYSMGFRIKIFCQTLQSISKFIIHNFNHSIRQVHKNLLGFDPCSARDCVCIILYLKNLLLQRIFHTFDQNTFNCNLLFLLDMLSNYEIQFICICELNTSYILIGTAKKIFMNHNNSQEDNECYSRTSWE